MSGVFNLLSRGLSKSAPLEPRYIISTSDMLSNRQPTQVPSDFGSSCGGGDILAHMTLAQNIDSIVPITDRPAITTILTVRLAPKSLKPKVG